jgi:transcriptional regulator
VDESTAWTIVREAQAGTLVVSTAIGLRSVFLPFLIHEDEGSLIGHLARANPLWRDASDGNAVVVNFVSAYGYVSPSNYPTRFEVPRAVPTWDYVAAEVRGSISIHDDPRWARGAAEELTVKRESSRRSPWSTGESDPDYLERLTGAIVGIEIHIEEITGVRKVSQTRPGPDRVQVRVAFAAGTHRERHLAELMDDEP